MVFRQNKINCKNSFLEAPIPSLRDLLQLLRSNNSPNSLALPWCTQEKEAYFFSRGTWAIDAFIQWLFSVNGKECLNIFLPAYFCNVVLKPLRQRNIKLSFYPICEDLSPDWGVLENGIGKTDPPDIFILVHYFGFPCGAEKAYSYCQKTGSILLEDCAHVFMPTSMMGQKGHAVIYSLHKVLGTPDGGLLVINKNLLADLLQNGEQVSTLFDSLHHLCRMPSISLAEQLFWIFKKIVQRVYVNSRISWHRKVRSRHDFTEESVIGNIRGMSVVGKRLLCLFQQNMELFKQSRCKNYLILNEAVSEIKTIVHPLFSELPHNSIPYIYPLLVAPEYVEQLYSQLNRNKVPAGPWPDLPPKVRNNSQRYKTAIRMRGTLITLPIHQCLSAADISSLGKKLKNEVSMITEKQKHL